MSVGHAALLNIMAALALESVVDMDIIIIDVVVVVGEKLIFVAATSAQATLSYCTPHLECLVRHHGRLVPSFLSILLHEIS
jgi:hypothetical protein